MRTLLLVSIGFCGLATAFCPLNAANSTSRNRCFAYYDFQRTYLDAENFCKNQGGHLASITNAFEGSQLSVLAKTSEKITVAGFFQQSNYWIGLQKSNGQFQWTDGSPLSYQHWDNNDDSTYQCGSVSVSTGYWTHSDCSQRMQFGCVFQPAAPFPCDSGWTWNRDTKACYMVTHSFNSFDDAEYTCRRYNAHLTSIHSQSENAFVISLATASYQFGYTEHDLQCWIGLQRRCSDCDDWVWTDGSYVDYYNWAEGQPTSDSKSNCVELYTDRAKFLDDAKVNHWNNLQGGQQERVAVCKKPQYS